MNIQLNFINQSYRTNDSDIVIFQRNVATNFDEITVAWKVIQHIAQGDHHSFVFPMTMQIAATDSRGNFTPRTDAQNGQLFAMSATDAGDRLALIRVGTEPTEIQVLNNLPVGAIDAEIYRDGKLLARKTDIAPRHKGVFHFKPTIWIGAVSQVEEGEAMNAAIVSSIDTELSLLGIASANIVMTGGGPGATSHPFAFALRDIVMA